MYSLGPPFWFSFLPGACSCPFCLVYGLIDEEKYWESIASKLSYENTIKTLALIKAFKVKF